MRPTLIAFFAAAVLSASHTFAAEFIPLGNPLGFLTRAAAVSEDGTTVVGTMSGPGANGELSSRGFVWRRDFGVTELEPLDDDSDEVTTIATDVSADGELIAGYAGINGEYDPVIWTSSTEGFPLDLDDTSAWNQGTTRISGDGSIVVGSGLEHQGWRWTAETGVLRLRGLAGDDSSIFAQAVSKDGSTIVGYDFLPNGPTAWRWKESDGMVYFNAGLLAASGAQGVSSDGTFIVGGGRIGAETPQAFLWSKADGTQLLGGPEVGIYEGQANDVSDDGELIIGRATTDSEDCCEFGATVWTSNGARWLKDFLVEAFSLGDELRDWTLNDARDISSDGRFIVGRGINPDGIQEAFLIDLGLTQPGDSDHDGDVDLEDLNNVRNDFGIAGDGILGDVNGDDIVDLEDLNLVRNHFGEGVSIDNAVPEPQSWTLALTGAIAFLASFRLRSSQKERLTHFPTKPPLSP